MGAARQRGFLQRTDQQFHWRNEGYAHLRGFPGLARFAQAQGRAQGAQQALGDGLTVEWVTRPRHHGGALGRVLRLLHGHRLAQVGAALSQPQVLLAARRGHARALPAGPGQARQARDRRRAHMIGGDCLYGRYWGAVEHHPCLHFELCYYQAIEFASQHGLARVEAGAQGEHKLARGYLPTRPTRRTTSPIRPCAARSPTISTRARLRRCGGRGARRIRTLPQGLPIRPDAGRVRDELPRP